MILMSGKASSSVRMPVKIRRLLVVMASSAICWQARLSAGCSAVRRSTTASRNGMGFGGSLRGATSHSTYTLANSFSAADSEPIVMRQTLSAARSVSTSSRIIFSGKLDSQLSIRPNSAMDIVEVAEVVGTPSAWKSAHTSISEPGARPCGKSFSHRVPTAMRPLPPYSPPQVLSTLYASCMLPNWRLIRCLSSHRANCTCWSRPLGGMPLGLKCSSMTGLQRLLSWLVKRSMSWSSVEALAGSLEGSLLGELLDFDGDHLSSSMSFGA
mmetsp:Transcript_95185/g.245956  ORF Transcript_95185/g.245956 Transcript_95185/m.245956 type:complete len:269 (-) Transcript_95185:1900-2706(-)